MLIVDRVDKLFARYEQPRLLNRFWRTILWDEPAFFLARYLFVLVAISHTTWHPRIFCLVWMVLGVLAAHLWTHCPRMRHYFGYW